MTVFLNIDQQGYSAFLENRHMPRAGGIEVKKVVKNVVLTMLVLFSVSSAALLAYLYFLTLSEKDLTGNWTARLDMTEQAAVTALSWLQDIEGVSVSLEDMEVYMQDLGVEIHLTFEQTAHSEGSFQCSVLPESYDACNQAAYEAFAAAFQELLAERLHMAGYTGSTDREAVEALVTEAFGMSTVSYLMTRGPGLLPSLEELQARYDGSGTYKAAEGILTRQFEDGLTVVTRTEEYIREASSLVLSEDISSDPKPVIYTLQQSSDHLQKVANP